MHIAIYRYILMWAFSMHGHSVTSALLSLRAHCDRAGGETPCRAGVVLSAAREQRSFRVFTVCQLVDKSQNTSRARELLKKLT